MKPNVAAARQARRAILSGVLALPLLASRANAEEREGKYEAPEGADLDIRVLMLSTMYAQRPAL